MNALNLASCTPNANSRAHLDLRASAGTITWSADRNGIVLRLSAQGGDVALDLGPDAVAQLKQALAWAGERRETGLEIYQPA